MGVGIMSWRLVQETRKPPVPGRVLGASLIFAGLAFAAEYDPAARAAQLAAWAFVLAVAFKAGPQLLTTGGLQTNAQSPIGGGGQGAAAGGQA